jgi:rhamnose transport system permease protein
MIGRFARELSVAVALVGLLAVLAAKSPAFFEPDNLRNRILALAPTLVAAVGMTLVILARQIDISIGSQMSVCAVIAGLLTQAGWPIWVAGGAAVLTGAALGAANGLLVAGLGLPSIVVTLATLVVWREALRWWREGELVRNLPDSFVWFGAGDRWGPWLVVMIAAIVFVAFAWGMKYLAAGRAVYATGSDAEAARLAGVRPRRVVFGVFVLTGALTGLAALLSAVQLSNLDPNVGTGMELRVIAAVVVGGVAVSGGRGTLVGSLLGAALLGTVGPALVFLGTEAQWEKAVQGLIILGAVASDAFGRRGRV